MSSKTRPDTLFVRKVPPGGSESGAPNVLGQEFSLLCRGGLEEMALVLEYSRADNHLLLDICAGWHGPPPRLPYTWSETPDDHVDLACACVNGLILYTTPERDV